MFVIEENISLKFGSDISAMEDNIFWSLGI